jgi:hypothetical protein
MQIIVNNPYRVLGVFANSKASEVQKNKNKIKAFLTAEADVELEMEFPALGKIDRTEETVSTALTKINLGEDKIHHSLFWFFDGSLANIRTDEPAFDSLKDGNIQEACDTWNQIASSGEINARNFSAYLNLSTLLLYKSVNNGTVDINTLSEAVKLKLKFLESEFIKNYCVLVAGETYKPLKENLQQIFITELDNSLVKSKKLKISDLLQVINSIAFSAKSAILKHFVQSPISDIEKKIDHAKTQRKANPAKAADFGKQLVVQSKESLSLVKSILGKQDLKYGSIADKVADEVLQCGIEYFNKYRESDSVDPGTDSMNCFKSAKSIAIGSIINQRCDENISGLQEWINDKPERDKQKRIVNDFEKIKSIIDSFERRSDSIDNANLLLSSARPHLANIKNVLGVNDSLYLGLSSRVASDAQQMVVTVVNAYQKVISDSYSQVDKMTGFFALKQKVEEAWSVITTIGNMDVVPEFRSQYNTNKSSLSNLRSQLSQIGTGSSGRSSGGSSSSGKSGCYIATMVYGNYDHPQVIVLRRFRDNVLAKHTLGLNFISFYYKHSPSWVENLKDKIFVNRIIRVFLNGIIKILK